MELKATEIRNVLGIYDNDLLNAAVECERKEDLSTQIVRKIKSFHGVEKFYGVILKFAYVKEVLEDFGFKYDKSDEDAECHLFSNKITGDVVEIYPDIWYPCQGTMRFQNFILS